MLHALPETQTLAHTAQDASFGSVHVAVGILPAQKFVMQPKIPVETATRVYRRYLKLEPTHVEEYIAYLKAKVSTYV